LALELEIPEKEADVFLAALRNKFGDVIKNLEVLTIVKEFKYSHFDKKVI